MFLENFTIEKCPYSSLPQRDGGGGNPRNPEVDMKKWQKGV